MIEDYNKNSWINLPITKSEWDTYSIVEYSDDNTWIWIRICTKTDLNSQDYFPILLINYFLDDTKFQKENIESYINDNIKMISNVFFSEFFIDYDKNYKIDDINKWKKLEYEKMKEFDMKELASKENKDLLDSIMYIYYNLVKNIFEIENSAEEIWKLAKQKIFEEFNANAELFNKIWFETKRNLIDTASKVKKQIDTFIKFIF